MEASFNYALCMLILAILLGHYGHFLTFSEMFMTLFALLKGKNLSVRKISTFDFDHNFVILTMFPFNRYNFFLQSIFFS